MTITKQEERCLNKQNEVREAALKKGLEGKGATSQNYFGGTYVSFPEGVIDSTAQAAALIAAGTYASCMGTLPKAASQAQAPAIP